MAVNHYQEQSTLLSSLLIHRKCVFTNTLEAVHISFSTVYFEVDAFSLHICAVSFQKS